MLYTGTWKKGGTNTKCPDCNQTLPVMKGTRGDNTEMLLPYHTPAGAVITKKPLNWGRLCGGSAGMLPRLMKSG